MKLDEQKLVEITSATIFFDPQKELEKILQKLKFYPNDVRYFLIKMTLARLSETAGLERTTARADIIATDLYRTFFAKSIDCKLERE